jgi:hypothetical protein
VKYLKVEGWRNDYH